MSLLLILLRISSPVSLFDFQHTHEQPLKNECAVRADWHLAYDASTWAFVPAQKVLDDIQKNKRSTSSKTMAR